MHKRVFKYLTLLLFITYLQACDSVENTDKNERLGEYVAHEGTEDIAHSEAGDGQIEHAAMPRMQSYSKAAADFSGENYGEIVDNVEESVASSSVSTFSIDVDTASYTLARSSLLNHQTLPNKDSIRTEEFINYFSYDYPQPEGDVPFSIHTEMSSSPFHDEKKLLRIGIQGKDLNTEERGAANLVFLIDTSGSMRDENKLPLLKASFERLTDQLDENDTVTIVTYAGSAGVALEPTSGSNKSKILASLNDLRAGGSTNGADGINTAYQLAEDHMKDGGINRIILATDGDFNVGQTSTEGLVELIEEKAKTGIYLTVLGFGRGNLNDEMMENISNYGNGNYYYIDSQKESDKVFGIGLLGTLAVIAKDVKIQIEFNPKQVAGYRLIGYENRVLDREDFNDDQTDAGEIGSGHSVTALYELDLNVDLESLEIEENPLEDGIYVNTDGLTEAADLEEIATVKLRYKLPEGGEDSLLTTQAIGTDSIALSDATTDHRFATSVAMACHILRESEFLGGVTIEENIAAANGALGADLLGYREEFVQMLEVIKSLQE